MTQKEYLLKIAYMTNNEFTEAHSEKGSDASPATKMPHFEASFQELLGEFQDLVMQYYTPAQWDDFRPPSRLKMMSWLINAREVERSAIEEIKERYAYWFTLQDEILETERKITILQSTPQNEVFADFSGSPKANLVAQLVAAQERWRHPDTLSAQQQLATEQSTDAQTPAMLNIAMALQFLGENTGVTWSDAQLLSLISNAEISMYARVAPWAPICEQELLDIGIRERPFMRPWRNYFVKLSTWQIQEVWVNGETSLPPRTYLEQLPDGNTESLFLGATVIVSRDDIRMTKEIALKTLQKWESSRQPIAPGLAPPYSAVAAISPTNPVQVSAHKLRTNSLDAVIEKAIQQSPTRDTASVWLELRELALSGERPFTGEIVGKALCYTNDENKPDEFTRNALAGRLGRRK
jgi:hypothetical protein